MKLNLIAAVALLSAGQAQACNTDLLQLLTWTIAPVNESENQLDTTFRYTGSKPIRMIDATAGFSDVLGDHIARFALDRDLSLSSGQEFSQTGLWGPYTFERLLDMASADVVTDVCVNAVVYADGTIEKFD